MVRIVQSPICDIEVTDRFVKNCRLRGVASDAKERSGVVAPPISQTKVTTTVIVAEQSKSVSNFKGESATSSPSETICPCFSRVPRRLGPRFGPQPVEEHRPWPVRSGFGTEKINRH